MADTRAQMQVERWIVENYLPTLLGATCAKRRVPLRWDGEFEVDAASEDGRTVCCVSTAASKTARGRYAVGKMQKIRSDALYLLAVDGAARRVMLFTDKAMYEHFLRDQGRGRFPRSDEIELHHCVDLPADVRVVLADACRTASQEVSPRRDA